MSRGRPPGDYGARAYDPRSPGSDPASDRWGDDDSWMSDDVGGDSGGSAWPYSQQGLGQRPEADGWVAGQEFSPPWSEDRSGRRTPTAGPSTGRGADRSSPVDYYSDLGGEPKETSRAGSSAPASDGPDPWAERADAWGIGIEQERRGDHRGGRSSGSSRSHQRRDEAPSGRSRSGQRREPPASSGDGGRSSAGRSSTGRKPKDRDRERRPGPVQGDGAADEDYDWIKYLGEGRGGGPAGGGPGGGGGGGAFGGGLPNRPMGKPRRDLDGSRPGTDKPVERTGYAGVPGLSGRLAQPSRDPAGRSAPGQRGRVPGLPDPSARSRPVDDYVQPLYSDLAAPQPAAPPSPPAPLPPAPLPPAPPSVIDSQEYARPLYPPDEPLPPRRSSGRSPSAGWDSPSSPGLDTRSSGSHSRRALPGGGALPGGPALPGGLALPGTAALDRTSPADRTRADYISPSDRLPSRSAWPDSAPEAGRLTPAGTTGAWPSAPSAPPAPRRASDDPYGADAADRSSTPPSGTRRSWPDPAIHEEHSAHNGWPEPDEGYGRDAGRRSGTDRSISSSSATHRARPDPAIHEEHSAHNGWPEPDEGYGRDAGRRSSAHLGLTPPTGRRSRPDTSVHDPHPAHNGWPEVDEFGGSPSSLARPARPGSPGHDLAAAADDIDLRLPSSPSGRGPKLDFGAHEPSSAANPGWPDTGAAPDFSAAWSEPQSPSGRTPPSTDSVGRGPTPPSARRAWPDSEAGSKPGTRSGPSQTRTWTAWPENVPGADKRDEDDSDLPRRLQLPDDDELGSPKAAAAAATGSPSKTRPSGSPAKKKPSSSKKRGPAAKRVAAAKKSAARAKTSNGSASTPAAKSRALSAAKKTDRAVGDLVRSLVHLPRPVMIIVGCLISLVIGAAGYLVVGSSPPAHTITVPAQLGAFVKEPTLDSSTATALRNRIVAGASGEVNNVVAAVYEQSTGPGTAAGPQIVVFIGGNLTGGGSAGGFINGFMTNLKGSFITAAGQLGGQAACAPGANGNPSECAWADNDTFGVVVSATLSADGLAAEMRQLRDQVERTAK